MINNESLFDHFRTARRRGYRSGWTAPMNRPVAQVVSTFTVQFHGVPEPAETISETDVLDDSVYANCGECGEYDYAAMLFNGACAHCNAMFAREWEDTLAAIEREEYAMRGGPLVV